MNLKCRARSLWAISVSVNCDKSQLIAKGIMENSIKVDLKGIVFKLNILK